MTNGSGERLDRIERILEEVAESQRGLTKSQQELANSQQELAKSQQGLGKSQQELTKSQQEMAARQQYHDEAFERHDAEMKVIREAIAADAENIRALVRISEIHHQRLERLEGGEPA